MLARAAILDPCLEEERDATAVVTLAYLLAQARCDLLGITTVSGLPIERAMVASAICNAADLNVPIIPGAEKPLDGPIRQPKVPQTEVLTRWPHETVFSDVSATEFMAETIRSNPGEVILLAVGQMTNIADLFTSHPDIPSLVKSLHMMLGRFTDRQPEAPNSEWNVHCDPASAAIIYSVDISSKIARHTSIGLDVTKDVMMTTAKIEQHFTHPILEPVLEMYHTGDRKYMTFHDPLAAVTLFDDSICDYERGTATVNRLKGRDDGAIDWSPNSNGPHNVAVTVDPNRFFDSYFGVFG